MTKSRSAMRFSMARPPREEESRPGAPVRGRALVPVQLAAQRGVVAPAARVQHADAVLAAPHADAVAVQQAGEALVVEVHDGIAAGQAVAAGILWGWLAPASVGVPAMLFAAAAAGFLVYNRPPARIFMGDAGSGFCGFIAGALVLQQAAATDTSPLLWLIPLSLFFCDATVTLLTRVLRHSA